MIKLEESNLNASSLTTGPEHHCLIKEVRPECLLTKILNLYHNNPSEVIFEISNKFFNNFCSETIDLDNDKKLMKFYMDKRNFKYPNNFWVFSDFMWGKEYRKILKKNENYHRRDTSFQIKI